jgi:hypothetical protein
MVLFTASGTLDALGALAGPKTENHRSGGIPGAAMSRLSSGGVI